MDHATFVRRYQAGELDFYVDLFRATDPLLPPILLDQKWRWRSGVRRWISISLIPLGVALFFFVAWWIALLMTFAAIICAASFTQEFDDAVILRDAALQNPDVFMALIAEDIVRVLAHPSDGIDDWTYARLWRLVERSD